MEWKERRSGSQYEAGSDTLVKSAAYSVRNMYVVRYYYDGYHFPGPVCGSLGGEHGLNFPGRKEKDRKKNIRK